MNNRCSILKFKKNKTLYDYSWYCNKKYYKLVNEDVFPISIRLWSFNHCASFNTEKKTFVSLWEWNNKFSFERIEVQILLFPTSSLVLAIDQFLNYFTAYHDPIKLIVTKPMKASLVKSWCICLLFLHFLLLPLAGRIPAEPGQSRRAKLLLSRRRCCSRQCCWYRLVKR